MPLAKWMIIAAGELSQDVVAVINAAKKMQADEKKRNVQTVLGASAKRKAREFKAKASGK